MSHAAQFADPRHQPRTDFVPGDIASGYYIDLRGVAGTYETPKRAHDWLDVLEARRANLWPVSILQLGLGAWQLSLDDDEWYSVATRVADWALIDMDGYGRFAHYLPMPHTYRIDPPWHSAMAQGLAASLFARLAGDDLERYLPAAQRAGLSLIDPAYGLIADTDDGPVLKEYPASPHPHVLNGWLWALWGLHDLASLGEADASHAFELGIETLGDRVALYETASGWTTYDLYPHRIANVASPFYHRLHAAMLSATADLTGRDDFAERASAWGDSLNHPVTRSMAVIRKVGFRLVVPRRKAAA